MAAGVLPVDKKINKNMATNVVPVGSNIKLNKHGLSYITHVKSMSMIQKFTFAVLPHSTMSNFPLQLPDWCELAL